MRRLGHSTALVAAIAIAMVPAMAQDDEPLELGLEEQVDVQLVLVDFLVLDRNDRTVTDLAMDDFSLVVNGKKRTIASLDLDCPDGATDEPRPEDEPPLAPPAAVESVGPPRRIVLAFDYAHVGNVAETFDRVRDSLDSRSRGDEELMVVSLGQVIRIEMPWTRDLEEVRWTLQRMSHDPGLYAVNHVGLTEHAFFERLESLMDLMELWPGRKSVVLFSGPFTNDGFFHDPEFRDLGALSTAVRTSIYPVDSAGLQVGTRLGGSDTLRRLANETGGRMTSNTNDIGLAFAKARRDLGCTYTMGFYEDRRMADRKRRMTIRVPRRKGLRIVYPEFYVVRSQEQKRRSLFRTAALAPEAFESTDVRTELFVMTPRSPSRWSTLMGIEIRLPDDVPVAADRPWTVRGVVRRPNGTVVHSFKRDVEMPASSHDRPYPTVTLFEPLSMRPGRYLVTTVLSDPDGETPRAATRPATVSPIPVGEPFMVGPILGRSVEGDPRGFHPLLDPESAIDAPLESWTVVCLVDDEQASAAVPGQLLRTLEAWDADRRHDLDPVVLELEGDGRIRCHEQRDLLAVSSLPPGRYELTAVAGANAFVTGQGSVEFTLLEALQE